MEPSRLVQACNGIALIISGYRVFPGVNWPVRGVDHPPHQAPRLKKE